jgi:hypothetical protein
MRVAFLIEKEQLSRMKVLRYEVQSDVESVIEAIQR